MNRKLAKASIVAILLLFLTRAADPSAPREEVKARPEPTSEAVGQALRTEGSAGQAEGRTSEPNLSAPTLVRHCRLEYRDATNLGVSVSGVLQDCFVDLGDKVKAGQVLGRIDYREQEANVGIAEARYNLAVTRLRTADHLVASHAITKDDMDILKGEVAATLETLEAARAARQLRDIVARHDGVIVEIFHRPGESVNYTNDPVFRLVNWDVLRVTGFLDVVDAWQVHPAQGVRITPDFAGPDMAIKHEGFAGKVIFVDREIDPKYRTCRVVAEVNNRSGLLRSGLEARMEIKADPLVAQQPPSPGPRPRPAHTEALSVPGAPKRHPETSR